MNEAAELLYTKLFMRIAKKFSEVLSFRQATRHSMPFTQEVIEQQFYDYGNSIAHTTKYDHLFKDKRKFLEIVGGVKNFASEMAKNHLSSYQTSIDASSIVLAHSILDAAAMDCFKVIEIIAPLEDWEPLLKKRQISLEALKNNNYEKIMMEKISEYIEELDRKSLLEKIDKLFQICKPPANFTFIENHNYDRSRIDSLDNLRHEIIHGDGLATPIDQCDEDIIYMRSTALFLLGLIFYKYNLKVCPTLYYEDLKQKNK